MSRSEAISLFTEMVSRKEEGIELAKAALLFAKEEYPDLDIDKYLREIDLMAEEIKMICSYSVVTIGPKRYNELYNEFHNLNKLLAWGHARSLENVLEKVSCDLAVADQFGDENFLRNALLSVWNWIGPA